MLHTRRGRGGRTMPCFESKHCMLTGIVPARHGRDDAFHGKIAKKNCQHILLEFSKHYSCLVHDFVKNEC